MKNIFKFKFSLVILFFCIVFLIIYINVLSGSNESILKSEDSNIVTAGKTIYIEYCASCHGINLEGQNDWKGKIVNGMRLAPPHDETGHTWHHSDKYLFLTTKYGIEKIIGQKYPNNMPVYKDILNDEQIISVLSYIKSSWPKKIKDYQEKLNIDD